MSFRGITVYFRSQDPCHGGGVWEWGRRRQWLADVLSLYLIQTDSKRS